MFKAYAFLWEKCSKAMHNKISGQKDFENPMKLLHLMKDHLLNYQETCYKMSIIADVMRAFLNTKQKENEILQASKKI